ncbi:MAG: hypothetical protein WDN75_15240 [Bacteroidota bacterium]
MKEGFHSQELNRYLFEKGIVATHLVTQKKSLEKTIFGNFSGSRTCCTY